jgi:serine/threonine protein kinase
MSQLGEIGVISTGELLDDRYRLEEPIGEGGSARVYRAEDTLLGRTVAVKILYGPMDGLGTSERAQSEKALLASLSHHGLVTLYDARVSADQASYLVMEYVQGITLRDRIASGPMDPAEAATIAIDIAEALHVAHTAGIIHRDIKPSNILLWKSPVPGQGWRAKIADFGIAYLRDSTRVTSPGLLVGTAAYLAPEQALGVAPAPPADIYALGIVLLEALTGTRPFAEAEGFGAVMVRLQKAVPIPESLDESWQRLLRGMTAMRPDDRPTALDVAAAVGRISAGAAIVAGSDGSAVAAASVHADQPTAELPAGLWTDAASLAPTPPPPATVVLPAPVGSPPVRVRRPSARSGRARKAGVIGAIGAGAVLAASLIGAGLWSSAPAAPANEPTQSTHRMVATQHPTSTPTPTVTATPRVVAPTTTQANQGIQGSQGNQTSTGSGSGNPNSGPGHNKGKGKGKG